LSIHPLLDYSAIRKAGFPDAYLQPLAPADSNTWMILMIKKLMSISMAAVLAAGTLTVAANDAEARRGRGFGVGVAAGVIGLGILGAAAAANAGPRYYNGPRGGCYPGPRQCYWQRGACYYNRYGEYVCGPSNQVCNRPMICD
jgi:hypothetical protein